MKFSTFNARAEIVADSPVYRKPFRMQRCLIPANFFYEPDKITVLKPPHPWYLFQLKGGELFAFAGLYDVWEDKKTGERVERYTMITTEPNELVGKVHGRMPVILTKDEEDI